MKIEHVGIYSQDTRALANWYVENLGLRVVRCLERQGRPPIYFLAAGQGAEIEILPTEESSADRTLNAQGLSHVGLLVDDFEATEDRCKDRGISLRGIRDTSNGWRIGYIEDPDGNTLEIVHRPQ